MFFQKMKYRNSVYRYFEDAMQLYPRGIDNIFTDFPNIKVIVEKHRKRGKSPGALSLYIAALSITRDLSLLSDEERLTTWLQLRRLKVKELIDFIDLSKRNLKLTLKHAYYVGWALYSGRQILKEELIDAEDYRLFKLEIYGELANLVSENQRAGRIKAELDSLINIPWDFAEKQRFFQGFTGGRENHESVPVGPEFR